MMARGEALVGTRILVCPGVRAVSDAPRVWMFRRNLFRRGGRGLQPWAVPFTAPPRLNRRCNLSILIANRNFALPAALERSGAEV